MVKVLVWARRNLLNPEMPLFGLGIIAAATICILVAIVLWASFMKGLPSFGAPWSLVNYLDVFSASMLPQAALNTGIVGFGTVFVSLSLAVPMAWLIQCTNMPGKRIFLTFMFLGILLPGFLVIIGWIMLASPDIGIINAALRVFIPVERGPLSIYNIPSIALLQGMALSANAFFMVSGAFLAIDPSHEESAEVSGANRLQNLRRIALPLIMPAVVASAIYNFMTAVSMFEVAALLGMPKGIWVFSTLIYDYVHGEETLPNYGISAVMGVLIMVPTLFSLFFYQRMLKKSHRFATVTGKGYRRKTVDLGRWKWVGFGFLVFVFLIKLVLPFFAVLWTSLLPRVQMPSLEALQSIGLAGYQEALSLLIRSNLVSNTLQLMLSVALLSVFISLIFSWIVLRTRLPGKYAIDTISMLPHAVPELTFAFSVLFLSILLARAVPAFYGSLTSIILAVTIVRIPYTTRTITASLVKIHPELEEAVEISGGSRVTSIIKVILPLITPSLFYCFIWSALHSYREVTIPLFLNSPRNMVLSTAIWNNWTSGEKSTAAAMGIIMVFSMGVILSILIRAFPQFLGELKRR